MRSKFIELANQVLHAGRLMLISLPMVLTISCSAQDLEGLKEVLEEMGDVIRQCKRDGTC